jgi:hypothetical protein
MKKFHHFSPALQSGGKLCEDLKKIPLKKIMGIGISAGNPKFPKIEFSFVISKHGPIL